MSMRLIRWAAMIGILAAAGPVLAQKDDVKSLFSDDAAETDGGPETLQAAAEKFKAMLAAKDFAFTQPNPDKTTYRVTIESGGEAAVIVCSLWEADWKLTDDRPVFFVNYYCQIGPYYAADREVPPEMTRKMADLNDNRINTWFGINVDKNAGDTWALWINGGDYLRGLDAEVLEDNLMIVFNSRNFGREQLLPFMEE